MSEKHQALMGLLALAAITTTLARSLPLSTRLANLMSLGRAGPAGGPPMRWTMALVAALSWGVLLTWVVKQLVNPDPAG